MITNDIYTREDAEFLTRRGVLPPDRIVGVETGGCPHTAIREDASVNLEASSALMRRFPDLDLLFIESGGDNLAATFSPELVDATIYVIDVAEGEKIPRKGGPGIMTSGMLVINKIDLAPYVGADLAVMDRDAKRMRGERPYVFTNLKTGSGVDTLVEWIRALTPFRGVKPEPARVGRDGSLRLRFARSGERTILAQSRFSLPLQVLTPLTLADGASYLMLLNPTGGVLGGDRLTTEIVQEAGTHVCLTTPSATRIYRTTEKPAVLETRIRVGEGATLEYFPDHVIPHARVGASAIPAHRIGRGSRAIVLDSMAAGRVAHGERWKFAEMDSRIEVYACGKPAYVNRTRIVPAERKAGRNSERCKTSTTFPAWQSSLTDSRTGKNSALPQTKN